MRPLAIDLFSGLGGWAEGLEAEGFDVVRVDIADMFAETGTPKPARCLLMLQDVLTFHGVQAKGADLIVASPPCQEFSYRAMPWKRSKAKSPADVGVFEPSWWSKSEGSMASYERAEWQQWKVDHPLDRPDTSLFNACFRIQIEACEAAGRHIPMVVENVRGAQPWVGRAAWNSGSMYFWGDLPAIMPHHKHVKVRSFRFDGTGRSFQSASVKEHAADSGFRPTSLAWGNESRWFNDGPRSPGSISSSSSSSLARKKASALIAKIPPEVARWIGNVYYPR